MFNKSNEASPRLAKECLASICGRPIHAPHDLIGHRLASIPLPNRQQEPLLIENINSLHALRGCLGWRKHYRTKKQSSNIAPMSKRGERRKAAARAAKKKSVKTIGPPPKTQATPLLETKPSRQIGPKAKAIASAIFGAVGLFLGVYVLRPDISIEPYATTDPTRPFSQQFSVQNTSVYAIHQVQPLCGFGEDSNLSIHGLSVGRIDQRVETQHPALRRLSHVRWTPTRCWARLKLACGLHTPFR